MKAEAAIPAMFRCAEMGAHGVVGPVTSGQAEAASLTAAFYGTKPPPFLYSIRTCKPTLPPFL
jgi:hypothetical protein